MPRLTVFRIVKILLSPFVILLGLYLFLPSPSISQSRLSTYIQSTLHSGRSVYTVHEWDRSYAPPVVFPGRSISRPEGGCTSLILDWTLISDRIDDSVTLRVGSLSLNLTDHAIKGSSRYQAATPEGLIDVKHSVSFGLVATIGTGSTDHVINMPWFAYVDQILFHNQMHGFDYGVGMRVVAYLNAKSETVVEVWKDSEEFDTFKDFTDVEMARRASGLLIRFENVAVVRGGRAEIGGVKISEVKGRLPSRTYWVRKSLLVILAPILSVGLFVIEAAVWPVLEVIWLPFLIVYSVLVIFHWVRAGRPNFLDWSGHFWLTRPVFGSAGIFGRVVGRSNNNNNNKKYDESSGRRRSSVWGMAGPVFDRDDLDSEESDHRHQSLSMLGRYGNEKRVGKDTEKGFRQKDVYFKPRKTAGITSWSIVDFLRPSSWMNTSKGQQNQKGRFRIED